MVECVGFGVMLVVMGVIGAIPIDGVLKFFGFEEE